MQSKIKIASISGPTGVGKTETSIIIAKLMDAEVISSDSMQIYKFMDIGTAKPDMKERQGVVHHLMDFLNPDEDYSVADFCLDAKRTTEDIVSRGKFPLIVGGTGLYIDSFLDGVEFGEGDKDLSYRKELEETAEKYGNEYVHGMLSRIDSESAEKIHPNNLKRVIRALEIYRTSGVTKTEMDKLNTKTDSPYDFRKILFVREREELYRRIDMRVDMMLKSGLVEEVEYLLDNFSLSSTASQAIGYKEVISHLKGEITREEMAELIKRNTRRYAKRQLTWFLRSEGINQVCLDGKTSDEAARECIDIING